MITHPFQGVCLKRFREKLPNPSLSHSHTAPSPNQPSICQPSRYFLSCRVRDPAGEIDETAKTAGMVDEEGGEGSGMAM